MTTENMESVISVAEMSRRLQISRSRLYQLIAQNVMLPPIYSVTTRKPLFTEIMAGKNLEVKKRNIGINGQIVMFYAARILPAPIFSPKKKSAKTETKKTPVVNGEHPQLLNDLKALGLASVTTVQIDAAVKKCFPDDISQVDESVVLRTVFQFIKRQNSVDKVER